MYSIERSTNNVLSIVTTKSKGVWCSIWFLLMFYHRVANVLQVLSSKSNQLEVGNMKNVLNNTQIPYTGIFAYYCGFPIGVTCCYNFPLLKYNFLPCSLYQVPWCAYYSRGPALYSTKKYIKYDIYCRMAFYVSMEAFWMKLLMNKRTYIVMNDGWVHPLAKTLLSLANNLWWNIVMDDWNLDEKSLGKWQ
jgi:hypothetical protein